MRDRSATCSAIVDQLFLPSPLLLYFVAVVAANSVQSVAVNSSDNSLLHSHTGSIYGITQTLYYRSGRVKSVECLARMIQTISHPENFRVVVHV